MRWYEGFEVHKRYLSAILDLHDWHIVSCVLSERNDNHLVCKTFDQAAVVANAETHPLFHSDNGHIEGFWSSLKRARYYGRQFTASKNSYR